MINHKALTNTVLASRQVLGNGNRVAQRLFHAVGADREQDDKGCSVVVRDGKLAVAAVVGS